MALSTESGLYNLSGLTALRAAKVAIVNTEWNQKWVQKQMLGAATIAEKLEATIINTITVPGCVELPFGIRRLFEANRGTSNEPEAIIAFGLVIRGETPHFEYVAKMVTEGIGELNLKLPIPVIFGVLTLENKQQAFDRLGGAKGHKGEEAMITALKMIQINRALENN